MRIDGNFGLATLKCALAPARQTCAGKPKRKRKQREKTTNETNKTARRIHSFARLRRAVASESRRKAERRRERENEEGTIERR